MMEQENCTATAEELLKEFGSRNLFMKDATNFLTNEVFVNDMMASYNGKILLHVAAAQASDVSVLSTVVQAYKKAGLLATALSYAEVEGERGKGPTPLHLAIVNSSYENTVLLLKECQENCPETLTATWNGSILLHLAVSKSEGGSIVKYLLREHKDICVPMLLAEDSKKRTPLEIAGSTKSHAEFSLAHAKTFAETCARGVQSSFTQKHIKEHHMQRPRKTLEQAKELISLLHEPTMHARAAEAERQAKLREEEQFREKELKLRGELESLLQSEQWDALMTDYVLSSDEDTQKIALNFLASVVGDSEASLVLPPLTTELLKLLKKYLEWPEDDPVLKNSLKLVAQFSIDKDSSTVFLTDTYSEQGVDVLSPVLKLLRSLHTGLQYLCVTTLLHLAENREDNSFPEECKQPLLLVKSFSVDMEVKRVANDVLERLGASNDVPDPGTWGTADVCFWMEGTLDNERRSDFVRAFRDAEIDGLHLLELSPTEMAGLGVKFVSDQRNLSSLIDDLRRLNMRSVVGRKDVFLSYAHINVQFALQIKSVLNENGYTVWIDTAGIRAGQKWRTEIAHGIHDCRLLLFIMTPRSTNSQYCHDELSLAEEYKKPIITVKYEHAGEMDPGLKLTIQRRQWIDFSDATQFTDSCSKLLAAVHTLIGAGSGTENDDLEQSVESVVAVEASPAGGNHMQVEPGALSVMDVQELVAQEVEKARKELMATVQALEAQVTDLSTRLSAVENRQ